MAIALRRRRSSTSLFGFLKRFVQFVSIVRHGITAIGISARRYRSPTPRCLSTQSSFAAESPLSPNRSFDRHRGRRICGEGPMLRNGNRFILHATGKSQKPAVGAYSYLPPSSNSLSSGTGMSSRKRLKRPLPVPGAASFAAASTASSTGCGNSTLPSHRPLVIVLAGPTAVGKSDVAAELCSPEMSSDISQGHFRAQHLNSNADDVDDGGSAPPACHRGHVISADSVQAYRGPDIGANKPTPDEMQRTPHHLVNVVDPPADPSKAASYNAADWMGDAEYVVRGLTSQQAAEDGDHASDGDQGEAGEGSADRDASARRESIDKALRRSLDDDDDDDDDDAATLRRPSVLPVVVGGTMMYLQWLVHGRPDAVRPTAEAVERATNKIDDFRREAESVIVAMEGNASGSAAQSNDEKEFISEDDASEDAAAWNAAAAYVSSLGPVFARRVDKLPGRDWYRLRRLLEVAYTMAASKKGGTARKDAPAEEEDILRRLTEEEVYTGVRSGSLPDAGYDVRCFFLCPDQRMDHFHVVDERCEAMLLRGLLRETADLAVRGGLPEGSQLARAIGYRQSAGYLRRAGARREDGEALAAFVDDFATATRQYAKKQMQWFRRDARFAFVPVRMGDEKKTRAKDAARTIAEMCKLSPAEFEAELSMSARDDGVLPLSAQTKLDNERQGKKMKFFISKRTRLAPGSKDVLALLAEADECTRKVQGLGEEF